MINIIKDKYIDMIEKELIRRGLVENFKFDQNTNTVIMKTHLDKRKASMLATKAMMCLGTGRFGRTKIKLI
jgi:hypothetical protein